MSNKIVVFTGNLAYSVRKGIVEIDRAIPNLSWLIVLHSPNKALPRLLRNQWRNLRRNGWRWIPYQTTDIVHRLRSRTEIPPGPNSFASEYTESGLTRRTLQVLKVSNIHSESSIEAVKKFAPDLGLSLAAPILRRQLFSIPALGTLNLHKGQLPNYRGMPPAFWELWNDEKTVGCTVHWVDDKLDTGNIAAECTVDCEEFSTVRGLQLRLDEVGVALMRKAVSESLQGTARSIPQPSGGKTNRKPTLAKVAALDRKLTLRHGPGGSLPKLVKNTMGETAFGLWRLGLRSVLAPRITVLLYHRVTDSARDNLTVGIEQFDRHMALLHKYCEPLSIEEVVKCKTISKSGKPLVCVTFDDGYLDNYLNAAPILLRNEIPAGFFVSTGIVGAGGRFPHDIQRGNPPIPVMTWEQLREMRASGFTIGSHSVSHIDCVAESEEAVWEELVRSRADLNRELGLNEVIFAYPYGGRHHMNPQRLELVKKAGYSACLSAYGGSNVSTVDRFNVLRRGIHWEFSDQAFMFECLGLT